MELTKKMKVIAVTHVDPRMQMVPPEFRGEEIYLVLQDLQLPQVSMPVEHKHAVGEGHLLLSPRAPPVETVLTISKDEYAKLGMPHIDSVIELIIKVNE
jgi:hypothetical protein